MKALIALSFIIVISACTKKGGKGDADGDEAQTSSDETKSGDPSKSTGSTQSDNENYDSKNDKDLQTDGGTSTETNSSGSTGSSTTPNDSSGSNSGSTPSATSDADNDGVMDDRDVCPGEDDALQVTRYKLTDADSDNYADGSLSANVCPSNTEYPLTLAQVVYSDCNSADATKWQTLAYAHRDADADGHSVASSGSICAGNSLPTGYLASALGTADCDDTNNTYHTIATYYSYSADAITSDRYTRTSESKCIPSNGYGSTNAYKEYRLAPDVISASGLSSIKGFTEFNGKFYFRGTDGTNGIELWATDGTLGGTSMLKNINSGSSHSSPDNFISVGGKLFFTADDGSGIHLWKTDGTEAGTSKVKSIIPTSLTAANDLLYFVALDPVYGTELWKSDGTATGTVVVKDINPDYESSSPALLTYVNGTLFFIADDDSSNDKDLWKSNGTEAGTVKIKDIDNVSGTSLADFVAVGSTLFFTAKLSGSGRELWKSDGTTAGTVLVKDIRLGNADSFVDASPSNFAAINGILYFLADDATSGKELWKSDGTEAGTVMVKDIWSGANGSLANNLINVNGTLFLTADNGTTGSELWKSNGTEAGTVLVKDIKSGNTDIIYPTAVGSVLYFRTDDGTHNAELWKSDGTETGTILVKDIHPASASVPTSLTASGNQLLFVATTPDGSRIHRTPNPL